MTKFVLCHHAERADRRPAWEESDKYPGITRDGEKETREKTKMLADMIRGLPDGSVVILGGYSKAVRTKSTLMVFTDELREILKDDGVIFSERFNSMSPLDSLKKIAEKSGGGKGKIIIDFPLRIEEFIALPGQKERLVANGILSGLFGAEGFFRRFFPNNPLSLISVGHSHEIDALINFLHKKNGKVSSRNDKVNFHFM